jgi:Mor family transcriptional regulator
MAYVHTIRATRAGQIAYCNKRNEQIYAYSLKGWKQAELADKYKITAQRVGQILKSQARLNRRAKQKKAS